MSEKTFKNFFFSDIGAAFSIEHTNDKSSTKFLFGIYRFESVAQITLN